MFEGLLTVRWVDAMNARNEAEVVSGSLAIVGKLLGGSLNLGGVGCSAQTT